MPRRALDWFLGINILGIGLILLQRGAQIGGQSALLDYADEPTWSVACILIGLVRMAALIINGHLRSGASALIRAGAAVLGASFWALIAAYSIDLSFRGGGGVSITLWWYALLIAGEIWCAGRGGFDFVHIRRGHAAFDRQRGGEGSNGGG